MNLARLESGARWRNVFTGQQVTATDETLVAAELFTDFPVALLLRESSAPS